MKLTTSSGVPTSPKIISPILKLAFVLALAVFQLACGNDSNSTPPQIFVTISPAAQSMFVNGTQQFSANVSGGSSSSVTWSVVESGGGTVDNAGKYTAPATAGTYHVKAASKEDASKSATAAVTVTVPAPTFNSTPVTVAAQDTAYSYAIDASDPAGTAVTLALTTGPDGATMSGNTIAWTPTWQQARQQNAFIVTATSAAGGTNTQSWAVAPTGTIRGDIQISHWSNDGTVEIESNSLEPPTWNFAALVPQADGSLSVLPGIGYQDATFEVPNVPAGYYWLQFNPGDALWTNASRMDYGSDAMGRKQRTPLVWSFWGCDVSGLDPWESANHEIDFYSINAQAFAVILNQPWYGLPTEGSTTCNGVNGLFPMPLSGIPGDVASAVQFEQKHTALTFFDAAVVGPAFNQPFTLGDVDNGQQKIVTAALTRDNPKTQDFNIGFSGFKTAFDKAGPSPSVPQAFQVFVESRERADGLKRDNPMLYGFYPYLAAAQVDSTGAWPKDTNGNNVWPDDGDYGSLDFNDPFSQWDTTVYQVWATAQYQIPFPNSDVPVYATVRWITQTPTLGSPIVPMLDPVGDAQINGTDLLTQSTVPTVSPTLSWTAPASDAPVMYNIDICEPVLNGSTTTCNLIQEFGNYTLTSFTVPAGILTPGHSYIFVIQADARTGFDPLRPNRYQLPEATTILVSAAITIDAGAAPGVVHGARNLLVSKVPATERVGRIGVTFDRAPVKAQTSHANSNEYRLLLVKPAEQKQQTPQEWQRYTPIQK